MPLSPRVAHLTRPSSLPLPRGSGNTSITEVIPPPHVPRDLATPSPVRPRHVPAKLHVDNTRAGSLSPAITTDKIISERKVSDKSKNNKFVKLLDHNIQNSASLYKQSGNNIDKYQHPYTSAFPWILWWKYNETSFFLGISKTSSSSSPGKQLKESKTVSNKNSKTSSANKNAVNNRKTSDTENTKPTSKIVASKKSSDEKPAKLNNINRKESVRKSSKGNN